MPTQEDKEIVERFLNNLKDQILTIQNFSQDVVSENFVQASKVIDQLKDSWQNKLSLLENKST